MMMLPPYLLAFLQRVDRATIAHGTIMCLASASQTVPANCLRCPMWLMQFHLKPCCRGLRAASLDGAVVVSVRQRTPAGSGLLHDMAYRAVGL